MLCFPNAKINIGLNIVERRADGFHNIETVFYPMPLADILEVVEMEGNIGSKVKINITGMNVSGSLDDNLCVKAYNLLDSHYTLPPVHIFLHKIIPMGAGLGGGSSDCAFALNLLNKLFELKLDYNTLVNYATQMGSDCAFFLNNKPAFGVEKGNILSPVYLNLKGYFLVLVKPNVFVGTADAYSGVKPSKPLHPLNELINKPIEEWRNSVVNDFEQSIFVKYPEIKNVKEQLYHFGAVYSSMTGSGSAVYGFFKEEVKLESYFKDAFYWSGYL